MNTISSPRPKNLIGMACLALLARNASGQAWDGSSSKFWPTAANWTPSGIPAAGANISVQSSTTNSAMWLDLDRSIGSFNFGTRTTAFDVQTGPDKTLTVSGGLTATGNFTSTAVALGFRGNHVLSVADHTWQVAGDPGGPLPTNRDADRGVGFRATEEEVIAGSVVLNGNLTKTGSGQLSLVGTSLSGSGDLIVNEGSLKANAGSGLAVSLAGSGSLVVNNSAMLFTSRNSGSFGTWTRPIVMAGTSNWFHQGGQSGNNIIASPIAWNGAEHTLTLDRVLTLSGPWSGTGTVVKAGTETLVLTGASPAFHGILRNDTGLTRIEEQLQGSVAATGGSVAINGTIGGSVTSNSSAATLVMKDQSSPALIGGNLTVDFAKVSGEALVTQGIHLNSVRLGVRPDTGGRLKTSGNLTLSGFSDISVDGPPVSGQPFAILEFGGSLTLDGGAVLSDHLQLADGHDFYRSPVFSIHAGNPKQLDLTVSTANLTWTGATDSVWIVGDAGNWSGGSPPGFHQLDSATFSDSSAPFVAEMSGTLRPGLITFNTSAGKTSEISSTDFGGQLSGGTRIVKNGAGTVILEGGTNQDYSGTVAVNQGVLRMGTRTALGYSSGIHITNDIVGQPGGQVDLNGAFSGPSGVPASYHFHIDGSGPDGTGALINTQIHPGGTLGTDAGVHSLTLTGNAKISSAGRYDVGFSKLGGTGVITGNGHTLTVETGTFPVANTPDGKTGLAFMGNAGGSLIHIQVASGVVWAQDHDHAFGGPGSSLTIAANARAGTFGGPRTIPVNVIIQDEGMLHSQGSQFSGTSTWTGDFTLAGDAKFHTGGHRIHVAGDVTQSVSGATLDKQGAGVLVLSGECSYTGTTTVTTGTLLVDGEHGTAGSAAVNVSSGATVGGHGTIHGNVSIPSGADIAPGEATSTIGGTNSVGTLATGNLSLTGDYLCEIDGDASDRIEVQGNLTLTSTPDLEFSLKPQAPTQDFYVVATYTGTLSGSFTGVNVPSGYTLTPNAAAKRYELARTSSGYAAWVNSYNVPGAEAVPLGNPEGDRFTNFDEFLFGTSPVANTGSLVSITPSGSTLELRWLQRSSGNTYTPQQSTTLAEGSWTTISSGGGITLGNDPITAGTPSGYTRRLLTFNIPTTGPRRFVRIIGQ